MRASLEKSRTVRSFLVAGHTTATLTVRH